MILVYVLWVPTISNTAEVTIYNCNVQILHNFQNRRISGIGPSFGIPNATKTKTFRKLGLFPNAVFWDVTPCGCCKNRRFGVM
jgi:hypothetical protein